MKKIIFAAMITLSASGCASIVGDSYQTIQITTEPSDADYTIHDENGKLIAQGTAPIAVTLAKSSGRYFGKKSYDVNISMEGYQPREVPIRSHVNGWYFGGNFIFGGLIGWFLVDPFNGGMYTLSPEHMIVKLQSLPTPMQDAAIEQTDNLFY